ncbi:glutamate-cysteine ligase family protein [Sulfurovum sp. zt1-1]|uniref:Glutamate-cysteine ligase family protein n=1 Tax=Sulfurovum zhangzhouensis TaxID=3019067 RepID=A0ABT7QX54_9BACT|nr:glutamate-cysteine ligase family protein [Sulfurovum zhangzhouensis]MDM5271405.1 glutamate-cysteine ligase family protein [Sulfurovum zhangzhouensis]
MVQIGIEHEFVFKDSNGIYLDFETAQFPIFQQIVDAFPYFENDDEFFECKSLERRPKRCYVEGFERYDSDGQLVETIPKGLEIRTLPYENLDDLLSEFTNSYLALMKITKDFGFSPLLTSLHPFKNNVTLHKPLNQTELDLRTPEALNIAINALLWHGLHVNVSIQGYTHEQMTDLVHKLNYYTPFIIPFSFSSPFYEGKLFEGLSYRTFKKANKARKAAQLQNRKGSYVIEFRGYDACGDANLMKALILLVKGLVLDKTLHKRALTQDPEMLKLSALEGFENQTIKTEAIGVLEAVKSVIADGQVFEELQRMLYTNDSYALKMKQSFLETGDILQSISNRYHYS